MKSTKHEIRSTNKEKHEARNSKYETNLNDKNPKFKTFWSFGHLNFDIVSDFDPPAAGIDRNPALLGRISDLITSLFRISTRQRRVSIGSQHCWVDIRIYSTVVSFSILIAAACLGLCGCAEISGYSNESLFPQEVDSIYLEMFDNQTFRRGAEYELSDALSKRIEAETPYKIVSSRDRADTVISGQIVSIGVSALSTERETGRVLEKEVELQALVNWKNLKTGDLLIDNISVSASASYTEYQKQDFKYASSLAANKLARKIVELMEKKW